ncbi:MAG TPA: phosphotransferase [Rubrobacteraceae bacterium]|nr:phosphotransferase [Rubrobacteraceae bacterium]
MVQVNVGTLAQDPTLPDLAAALDSQAMLKVFRKHLRPIGDTAYEIQSCRLSRIRYRMSFRCILQYTLSLLDPDTGRQRNLLISGTMYADADAARRRFRKLLVEDLAREIPDSLLIFEPVSFVSDLGMLLQVFPYDRKLPTLPLLAAGPPPDLEPLLVTRLGPGDWRAAAWKTESVRYREQIGAVLRYDGRARNTATGEEALRRFYVKVYRDDTGERTLRALGDIRRICDESGESFTVGTPVAYTGCLRALVLEEAPGASLEDVLLDGDDTVETMRKVARDLAAFNQLYMHPEQRYTLMDQISSLERSARLLRWACPNLSPEIDTIVATVADGLEEVRPRPTHRDLKPDHIFLDGARTVFIDLDSFAGADPVLDPALFLAWLAALPDLLPVPRSRARMASRTFASEYFAHVPKSWHDRLYLHYSGALLEVAQGFFRRQEPGWPTKITALVREAEASLGGGIW